MVLGTVYEVTSTGEEKYVAGAFGGTALYLIQARGGWEVGVVRGIEADTRYILSDFNRHFRIRGQDGSILADTEKAVSNGRYNISSSRDGI